MYNLNNEMNIKGDLALIAQRNARQYRREVAKKRKIKKCKRVALGIIGAAFFIAGMKVVGNNDLEAFGIVEAKETEVLETTHTMYGEILYKGLIETEDGMRWAFDTYLPEGTEVVVEFNDNGTETPLDDIIVKRPYRK